MIFKRKVFDILVITALAAAGVVIGLCLADGTSPGAADPPAVHAQAGAPVEEKVITVAPPMMTAAVWITS